MPTPLDSPEAILVTAAIRDITTRKDAEKHLAQTEARYRGLLEAAPDAMVVVNQNGEIVLLNIRAEKQFGYSRDELLGLKVKTIIPEGFAERLIADGLRSAAEALAQQIGTGIELYGRRKDGSDFPIEIMLSPLDSPEGILVTAAIRDITTRKDAEKHLAQTEARYRGLLEAAPDAMVVVNQNGEIVLLNIRAEEQFGYSRDELLGLKVKTIIPEGFAERLIADGLRSAAEALAQQIGTGIELYGRRKDGSDFPIEIMLSPLDSPEGILVTAAIRDITTRKKAEVNSKELSRSNDELEQFASITKISNDKLEHLSCQLVHARDVAERANRAKSRFLAGMSHELRTPLNGILGYTQLLRMEGGLNAVQSARLEAMSHAGAHLLEMIHCVLDLSEIETERVEMRTAQVDLRSIVGACLDLIRPAAEAKRLSLDLNIGLDMPCSITTDPTRLRQILLNLLGNAVKFTTQGAVELRIRTLADGAGVRFEIVDTGPGIPANQRRRLFEEFERLDTHATRTVEGAGLGLALSSRIASLIGGRLSHEDNPGGGSVFWLELPLVTGMIADPLPETAREPGAQGVQPGRTPARALRVLVVDDIAMNRDIASSFIRSAGHEVTCVEGGGEAVEAATTMDFDVVMMDVRMPEIDGLEATRRIRALEGVRGRVPIMALTAQVFTEQLEECHKAGMNGHVIKPFTLDALLRGITHGFAAGQQHERYPAAQVLASSLVKSILNIVPIVPTLGSELSIFDLTTFEGVTAFLDPNAIVVHLQALAKSSEALLCGLRAPEAFVSTGAALAATAHMLAGSAGMFGFERLAFVSRHFERALQTGAAELPSIVANFIATLEITLEKIRGRMLSAVKT